MVRQRGLVLFGIAALLAVFIAMRVRTHPAPVASQRPTTAIARTPSVRQPPVVSSLPAPSHPIPPAAPAPVSVSQAHEYWLVGAVVTPDRRPVESFTLELYPIYHPLAVSQMIQRVESSRGEFELRLKDSTPVDIVATASGFTEGLLPQATPAPSRDEATLWEITLVPEARIRGQVVTEKGEPITDAQVELGVLMHDIDVAEEPGSEDDQEQLAAYLDESNPNPHVRTDSSGRFELTGLPQGIYQLFASHPGYFPTATEVTLRPGTVLEDVRLVLSTQGGVLVVRVVDQHDGPLAGQAVKLEGTPIKGVTDEQGLWRAEELPPGIYRIILSAAAEGAPVSFPEHWADVVVTAGQQARLTFRISRGVFVRGEVTRAGRLVGGIEISTGQMRGPEGSTSDATAVSYARRTARTDAMGRFELPGLPPGDYALTATQGDDRASLRFTLADTDRDRMLHIRLGDARAEGVVRDSQTHQPIPGAYVEFVPLQLEGDDRPDDDLFIAATKRDVQTDPTGRYRVEGLAAGLYALDVSGQRYGRILNRDVTVTEPVFHYDINLWSSAQLIVTVITPQRVPVYRARVQISPATDPEDLLVAATNSLGLANLEDLAPGTYEILVDSGTGVAGTPPDRTVVQIGPGDIKRLNIILTSH